MSPLTWVAPRRGRPVGEPPTAGVTAPPMVPRATAVGRPPRRVRAPLSILSILAVDATVRARTRCAPVRRLPVPGRAAVTGRRAPRQRLVAPHLAPHAPTSWPLTHNPPPCHGPPLRDAPPAPAELPPSPIAALPALDGATPDTVNPRCWGVLYIVRAHPTTAGPTPTNIRFSLNWTHVAACDWLTNRKPRSPTDSDGVV